MKAISECKAGDRVQLGPEVLHKEYAGLFGTVKKTVKCRNMVVVVCDNGKEYRAFPENVSLTLQAKEDNTSGNP